MRPWSDGMLCRMYPTLATVQGVAISTHGIFVALGTLAATWVFVVEARRRGQTDERIVYVVLGALVGGAIFMRLGHLAAARRPPSERLA